MGQLQRNARSVGFAPHFEQIDAGVADSVRPDLRRHLDQPQGALHGANAQFQNALGLMSSNMAEEPAIAGGLGKKC